MAKGLNHVQLIGNVGADPETRVGQSGSQVCTVSLATSESWKDKQTGEKQERTEWHRVKFFGKLAEIAGQYIQKGRQIYVDGSLRTSKYTDQQGVEKYSTDIIANNMLLLGGNGGGEAGSGQAPQRAAIPQRAATPQRAAAPQPAPAMAGNDFGDDVPF